MKSPVLTVAMATRTFEGTVFARTDDSRGGFTDEIALETFLRLRKGQIEPMRCENRDLWNMTATFLQG